MTDKIAGRNDRSRSFYGNTTSGGGSLDLSLGSYYDRRDALFRDDRERLEHSRAERRVVKGWAQKRGINPAALSTVLSALHERESLDARQNSTPADRRPTPVTDDALAKLTFETLRREEGSEAAATALWQRAQKGAEVLNQELPSVAKRASDVRATVDPRVLRFLASIAPEPVGAA